jgi:hypothetical protein
MTPDWGAELLRVIKCAPHPCAVPSANWTTTLLAACLGRSTGITVSAEAVRLRLDALGSVC